MQVFSSTTSNLWLFYLSVIAVCLSSVSSKPLRTGERSIAAEAHYSRMATHCYIENYSNWLERQQELLVWLRLAQLLQMPIDDSSLIKQELNKYRLQYECLRIMERLPVSVGPG